jgi:hypothetical protein
MAPDTCSRQLRAPAPALRCRVNVFLSISAHDTKSDAKSDASDAPHVESSPHQTMPTMDEMLTVLDTDSSRLLLHSSSTLILPLLHPQSLLYSIGKYLGNAESFAQGFFRTCSRANLENALRGRELLPSAGCRCHCTCCVHNPQILLLLARNALILIMHNWRRHRVYALLHPLPQPTSACEHVSSWVSAHLAPTPCTPHLAP